MYRLTKKIGENYCSQNGDFYDLYNKLGKLEDLMEKYKIEDIEMLEKIIIRHDMYNKLEEELLGCPLKIVFKAVLRWIYYEDSSGNMTRAFVDLHTTLDGEYVLLCDNTRKVFYTEDYKKTWWLKEDKSE